MNLINMVKAFLNNIKNQILLTTDRIKIKKNFLKSLNFIVIKTQAMMMTLAILKKKSMKINLIRKNLN
jgi:hypothetical protein